jgi:hypothetical protein
VEASKWSSNEIPLEEGVCTEGQNIRDSKPPACEGCTDAEKAVVFMADRVIREALDAGFVKSKRVDESKVRDF